MSGLNYWNGFETFKRNVREIGGVWAGDDVYFSQLRDGYSAAYKPKHPEYCNNDMIINTLAGTGAQNRGNYELIRYRDGKFGSEYFENLDDIREEER